MLHHVVLAVDTDAGVDEIGDGVVTVAFVVVVGAFVVVVGAFVVVVGTAVVVVSICNCCSCWFQHTNTIGCAIAIK